MWLILTISTEDSMTTTDELNLTISIKTKGLVINARNILFKRYSQMN